MVVDLANKSLLGSDYTLLDVVERSAIEASVHTETSFSSRPSSLPSLASGIKWQCGSNFDPLQPQMSDLVLIYSPALAPEQSEIPSPLGSLSLLYHEGEIWAAAAS